MPRRCEREGSSRRYTHPCRETLQAEKVPLVRVRTAARRMKKSTKRIVLAALCAAMALPVAGQAPDPAQVQTQVPPPALSAAARSRQRAAPPSAVTVDGS